MHAGPHRLRKRNECVLVGAESYRQALFAFTEIGARSYMESAINAARDLRLTRTSVPTTFLERGFKFHDTGGAGPSIHFAKDALADLYRVLGPIEWAP